MKIALMVVSAALVVGGCTFAVLPKDTVRIVETVKCTTTGFEDLPPGRYEAFVRKGDGSFWRGSLIVELHSGFRSAALKVGEVE